MLVRSQVDWTVVRIDHERERIGIRVVMQVKDNVPQALSNGWPSTRPQWREDDWLRLFFENPINQNSKRCFVG